MTTRAMRVVVFIGGWLWVVGCSLSAFRKKDTNDCSGHDEVRTENSPAYDQAMSASALIAAPQVPVRIGVVSFLNTLPLIDGLDRLENLQLRHSVPSVLVDQLVGGEVEMALCSSIDYQRSPTPLMIIPVGLLGCDGPTLTVRLYSGAPIDQINEVHCDTDSHTSVALLQILLKEQHGITPALVDYNAREHVARNRPVDWPDSMLLIGDKVVSDSPPAVRYPYQLDLGAAWRQLTGLPFVFAIWMTRVDIDPQRVRTAAMALDYQRRHNIERIDRMIHLRAAARGWPSDLAREYLKQKLSFESTERSMAGLELFFEKALRHGLITERRALRVLEI
jgi:chorismate dehydratase